MEPNAFHSYLTKLFFSSDGVNYTEVDGVTTIDVPELVATAAKADGLTDLGKVTVQGKVDLGELTCTAIFRAATYAAIKAMHRVPNAAPQYQFWRIVYPDFDPVEDGSHVDFAGYVLGCGMPTADDDECIMYTFRVKVNDFPTFTEHP